MRETYPRTERDFEPDLLIVMAVPAVNTFVSPWLERQSVLANLLVIEETFNAFI